MINGGKSPPERVDRRLAAILAADVAGYSRIVGDDEEQALRTLQQYRSVTASLVEEHHGRIVGTAGDGLLAKFPRAVQAVRSAVAVQRAINRHNADLEEQRRTRFRIGINLGDVMVHDGDILGDGVNLAARLEQMAEPGGILVSGAVWQQIEGKLAFPCTFLGERAAKNIARPVTIYQIDWEQPEVVGASLAGVQRAPPLPNKPSIAVRPFTNMSGEIEQVYQVYETLYCARGQAEKLIKAHKPHLASDRTSCRRAVAKQVRLVLHTGAYWLLLRVKDAIPQPCELARAEFSTIRLRLMKIAVRVKETASRVRLAFAAGCPGGRTLPRPCGRLRPPIARAPRPERRGRTSPAEPRNIPSNA